MTEVPLFLLLNVLAVVPGFGGSRVDRAGTEDVEGA